MARASTPSDPLEPMPFLAAGSSIPVKNQPWLQVGQVVRFHREPSRYYLKKLLKESGKKIAGEILAFLRHGQQLEFSIAGIKANYALPTIFVCNQCYLQDGQCHSGLSWGYRVLIKGVLDGKNVCVIPRVWIDEQLFAPLTEMTFQEKEFYRDIRGHVYKCVYPRGELAFVYVGHIRKDGRLSWDNHITSRRLTPWQRRTFQSYELPKSKES